MLKQLGIPTWFCSFSAADRRWPEILEAVCLQQGLSVPENPDWTEYCQLINSNPVTACRMFESRVLSFIHTVILFPAHPIGNVIDFSTEQTSKAEAGRIYIAYFGARMHPNLIVHRLTKISSTMLTDMCHVLYLIKKKILNYMNL